jgi:hypothetical protein
MNENQIINTVLLQLYAANPSIVAQLIARHLEITPIQGLDIKEQEARIIWDRMKSEELIDGDAYPDMTISRKGRYIIYAYGSYLRFHNKTKLLTMWTTTRAVSKIAINSLIPVFTVYLMYVSYKDSEKIDRLQERVDVLENKKPQTITSNVVDTLKAIKAK